MKKMCSLFCAGSYYGYEMPVEPGLIVAADGGNEFLEKNGIKADFVIGDFDSGKVPENGNVIRLNPVKDETDTYEAINLGIENGCEEFHVFGGTGGRTSHTLANIQALNMLANRGMRGFLYGNNEIFTVIHNESIKFKSESSGYVSVFSLDRECIGVTIKNLKYELSEYNLSNTYPIGVSNEFIGKESEIMVSNGNVLVVFPMTAKTK